MPKPAQLPPKNRLRAVSLPKKGLLTTIRWKASSEKSKSEVKYRGCNHTCQGVSSVIMWQQFRPRNRQTLGLS